MGKFANSDYEKYWKQTHQATPGDLSSVCFPDKPPYFNRFFDRVQKYALRKIITRQSLGLAGRRLLDIGCGRGRWLEFFQHEHQMRAIGLDLSNVAAHSCRQKGLTALVGSAAQMPFTDSTFDFVSSITVLLHLPYDLKEMAIREIARVLRPGGMALLIESTNRDPAPHVFGLTLDEWKQMFAKHRFQPVLICGHHLNYFRLRIPSRFPFHDRISIYLDYPLEYFFMNRSYGKESPSGLQHVMLFQKNT